MNINCACVCVQFKPLEQLMGVFPAASGNFLPETWRHLMCSAVSDEFRPISPIFVVVIFV